MTQQVFMRAFPAAIEQKGPRQLTGRLVPYNVIADVLDVLDETTGKFDIYREGFRRGAFDGQVTVGSRNKGVLTRIGLIHRHEGGLGYLGPCTGLYERDDGLYGDIRVLPIHEANVEALLDAGVDELSIEFRLRNGENTIVDEQGVRWRTKVHLDQVALEPKGAYSTAQVLQFRAELDELDREQANQQATDTAEEEAAAAEERQREAVAARAVAQKRAWDEMTARLAIEKERQEQLVKDYGVTQRTGYGTLL